MGFSGFARKGKGSILRLLVCSYMRHCDLGLFVWQGLWPGAGWSIDWFMDPGAQGRGRATVLYSLTHGLSMVYPY